MDPTTAEQTIAATMARLGLADTGLGSASETIARRPEAARHGVTLPLIALDAASSPMSSGGTSTDADLVARAELGRGGMGVVHLAEQRSLLRDVAVKRALSRDGSVASALVREARIMGSLEHPNLVPVHALGIDREGAPVLVMKRIEGVSWRTLLREPAHVGWQSLLMGHEDRLRANIEVLSQVCRALSFAHDKGVVHRDLKPDNVMIGAFGEVYLLDWGVALRLSEAAAEPPAIVGTPAYLAPEMAHGDPTLIDARADVYLLGATLYEVLSGRMPHEAPTPMAALVSALLGAEPPLPADAPAELAALVRHAMATKPAERVASADAFLGGLKRFLASREAELLVTEARLAMSRAEAAVAAEGARSSDAFRALIEARFGFVAARRVRPHDPLLQTALDECHVRLIERELALRSPGGARTLLTELATPQPALETRIAALERDLEAERVAANLLRDARENADTSGALRVMQRVMYILAAATAPIMLYQWAHPQAVTVGASFSAHSIGLLLTLAMLLLGRRTALANEATKRISAILVLLWITNLFGLSVSVALGGTPTDGPITAGAVAVGVLAATALTFMRDLWPVAVGAALWVVVSLAFPGSFVWTQVLVIPLYFFFWARAIRLHADRTRVSADRAAASE